jgi:hypothetical protein
MTLRTHRRGAAVVAVAKWCRARGEKVTIVLPAPGSPDALAAQFTEAELAGITFTAAYDLERQATGSNDGSPQRAAAAAASGR